MTDQTLDFAGGRRAPDLRCTVLAALSINVRKPTTCSPLTFTIRAGSCEGYSLIVVLLPSITITYNTPTRHESACWRSLHFHGVSQGVAESIWPGILYLLAGATRMCILWDGMGGKECGIV